MTDRRRDWPRRALSRFEIDRAVVFVLAARLWQLAAGPVTMLLIAARFSPEVQGFYYTFGSLVALQSFVELGLSVVLLNLAGHAWAGLSWTRADGLTGEPAAVARFRGLDAFGRRWYGAAAALFAVGVGVVGEVFFRTGPPNGVDWRLPWWAFVAATAGSLRLMPSVTLLEGCGEIVAVNRYRLVQAVCGNLLVWPLIAVGGGLWALSVSAAVRLVGEFLLTRVRFGPFLAAVRKMTSPRELNWRDEVWPLQWRMGLHSVAVYFAGTAFTPILFHFRGAEEAGRFGMTWALLTALQSAAFGWVQTRIPRLARLAAEGERAEFDQVWRRVTVASSAALAAGGAAFLVGLALVRAAAESDVFGPRAAELASRLAGRLLPLPAAAAFTVAVVLWHLPHCESLYLRAYRIDPLLRISLASNLLIGAAACLFGSRFGAAGIGAAYLVVVATVLTPGVHAVRQRFRAERDAAPRSGH